MRTGQGASRAVPNGRLDLLEGAAVATGQQAEPQTAKLMDPVCGLRVDPDTAASRSEYAGRVYYFQSVACQAEFDAAPAWFAGPPTAGVPAAAVADASEAEGVGASPHAGEGRRDPVCGMPVADGPEALHATFDQATYAFCSEECRRRFLAHPARYVSAIAFEPEYRALS